MFRGLARGGKARVARAGVTLGLCAVGVCTGGGAAWGQDETPKGPDQFAPVKDVLVTPYNVVAPAIPASVRDPVFGSGAPTAEPGGFSPNLRFSCGRQGATIVGTSGADTVDGTPAPDVIAAREGDDEVFGYGSDDTICGGPGADRLDGGLGDDLIDVGSTGSSSTIACEEAHGGPGSDVLIAAASAPGQEICRFGATFRGFGDGGDDEIVGGRFPDLLEGGPGDDNLRGGGEDDALVGEEGDDVLNGGPGVNVCFGGSGHDTYFSCSFVEDPDQ